MARIRTIKPGFFTDQHVLELSPLARLLFLSMLTQADDEGRLYDQIRQIGAAAFGDRDEIDVEALLREMATVPHPRIVRYEVDGERIIQIRNFDRHQVINRPTRSSIPAYRNGAGVIPDSSGTTPGALPEPSRSTPGGLRVGIRKGNKEEEEEEERSKGAAPLGAPRDANDIQLALLGRLHELRGWKRLTETAIIKLNGRFSRPVVTAALQRAREENSSPNGSAYGLLDAMCRDIAAKEAKV